MEDCRSKILGKENILFDLPSPHLVLGSGNDTNDVIIAAACAHQQFLMQDILSKTIERQIWPKVRLRDVWPPCRRNWNDFITNLRVDRGTFLLIVERLSPYIHRETTSALVVSSLHIKSTKSHFSASLNRRSLLSLFSFLAALLNARTREHA